MQFKTITITIGALTLVLGSAMTRAGDVHLAVAANFTAAMKEIATNFEQSSGHRALISFGSTGKLYAQIKNGAPFDVFLAADQKRPKLLEQKNAASGRFTYAVGKLVLWSSDAKRTANEQALHDGNFQRIAIANPKTAPYGAAAVEIMHNLGVYAKLEPKLVTGDSIAQTHQFVATGNAEFGFVALTQIALNGSGSRWQIPEKLYAPIRQDVVLLKNGKNNPAAQALLDYLQGDAAKKIILKYGYGVE